MSNKSRIVAVTEQIKANNVVIGQMKTKIENLAQVTATAADVATGKVFVLPSGATGNGTAALAKPEQAKTMALAMASGDQVIAPDSGKVLTAVTVTKPATLLPENIKQGVNIGGILGTLVGGAVAGAALSSIAITTPPTKLTYNAGDAFDPAGMVVTATYSNGATRAVTGCTYAPAALVAGGNVTVSFTEFGATKTAVVVVTVKAVAKALSSIAVTTPPPHFTYLDGEAFDSYGMVLTATYTDGSTAAVSGYSWSPEFLLYANGTVRPEPPVEPGSGPRPPHDRFVDIPVTLSHTEGGITKTVELVVEGCIPHSGGGVNNFAEQYEAKVRLEIGNAHRPYGINPRKFVSYTSTSVFKISPVFAAILSCGLHQKTEAEISAVLRVAANIIYPIAPHGAVMTTETYAALQTAMMNDSTLRGAFEFIVCDAASKTITFHKVFQAADVVLTEADFLARMPCQ